MSFHAYASKLCCVVQASKEASKRGKEAWKENKIFCKKEWWKAGNNQCSMHGMHGRYTVTKGERKEDKKRLFLPPKPPFVGGTRTKTIISTERALYGNYTGARGPFQLFFQCLYGNLCIFSFLPRGMSFLADGIM